MENEITSAAVRPWTVLIGRAVLVAAAAVAVTFSSDHSPAFGLGVIAIYALVSGMFGLVSARRVSSDAGTVTSTRMTGALGIVVGLVAVVSLVLGLGLGALVLTIAMIGAIGAVSEFLRSRRSEAGAPTVADHRILGTVAALLVVGVLLAHDNSVAVVGVFGAWAAVTAVFSLITAFTLKFEGDRRPDPMVNS